MVNEVLLIKRKEEKVRIAWKRRVKLMTVVMVAVDEGKEKKKMHKTQGKKRRGFTQKERKTMKRKKLKS